MPTGIILRSTGSRYVVLAADGTLHECVAKGRLRTKGWGSTNPVAVGDRVDYLPQAGPDDPGSITDLHERRNYMVRRSVNLSHHKHVIAANLDQALLMVTVARPRTSYGFIDRVLVTAEAYEVPVVIVFNKLDDLDDEELDLLAEYDELYQRIGYRTIVTSALKHIGVEEVKAVLLGRTTLLVGHSGVGKSTLVNAIDPELDLHTLEISASSSKGQHTTTNAEMYALDVKGWKGAEEVQAPTYVIDTPGVKGFGLVDMEPQEIVDQFPEFIALKGKCRFTNCMHLEEPGCAVQEALENGDIAFSRYNNYKDMLNGVDEETTYRTD